MAGVYKVKMRGIAADEGLALTFFIKASSASEAAAVAESYSEGGHKTDRDVYSVTYLGVLIEPAKVGP